MNLVQLTEQYWHHRATACRLACPVVLFARALLFSGCSARKRDRACGMSDVASGAEAAMRTNPQNPVFRPLGVTAQRLEILKQDIRFGIDHIENSE